MSSGGLDYRSKKGRRFVLWPTSRLGNSVLAVAPGGPRCMSCPIERDALPEAF